MRVKNQKDQNKNQTTNDGEKGKAKRHWGLCINVTQNIVPFILV